MTKEEAIKILKSKMDGSVDTSYEWVETVRMAIEALQAKTDGDLISRQDALKPFCIAPDGTRIPEVDCDNFPVEFSVEFIKKHLLSLPSAEPCDKDAISREGLLKSWEELSPRGRTEFDQVIMTIPALPSAKPNGDLISRQDAINEIKNVFDDVLCCNVSVRKGLPEAVRRIEMMPSAEPKTEWIPIKWHEITEEERDREGYPKDWAVHIDCEMPCDGQEIIVQTKSGCIRCDVCYEEGEFSLDSGWDWIEDIVAWQPLPEPYRREY